MAAPEQDKGSFPSINILAIIALITGAVLIQPTGFIPRRPTTTERVTHRFRTPQDVDARLWQDPFAAVAAHREEQLKDKRDNRPHPAHHRTDDVLTYLKASGAPRLLILPVMVLGGPWADEAEQRRRTRYAVVASLAASGFTADDPSHVGYLDLSEYADQGLPDVLPYEWFKHVERDEKSPKILVLWLDENAFMNEPLRKLSTVVSLVHGDHRLGTPCGERMKGNEAPPSSVQVAIKILGPATSTGLVALANDAQQSGRANRLWRSPPPGAGIQCGAHVFSSAPTIAAASVLNTIGQRLPEIASDSRLSRMLMDVGLMLWRTTATDDALAGELVKELQRRDVDLSRPDTSIAIITEWDTVYARQLRRAFRHAACATARGRCDRPEEPIDVLTYTSGLDGRVPAKQPATADPPSSPGSSGTEKRETRPVERADGTGQLDYLRRLAAQIQSKNYAAIGVLGSDTYDKLLVLQAIRPWAKQALVFTTDLDARLLHPEEFEWTRNLIVASAFGLRLAPVIQRHTPPFRDTYQTGTFLATRLAIDEATITPSHFKKWLEQPRVFEIGRTDAWDVTPEPARDVDGCEQLARCDGVHPKTSWWRTASSGPKDGWIVRALTPAYYFAQDVVRLLWSSIALIAGAMAGAALLTMISARMRRRVAWPAKHRRSAALAIVTVAVVLVIVGGLIYADGVEGEPVALFEGISIWPSELLRLFAAALAVVGICHLFVRSRQANLELTQKYFVESESDSESERDAARYVAQQRWRPSFRSARHSISSRMLLRPVRLLGEPVNAAHIWAVHLEESSIWPQLFRVIPVVAIYIGLGFSLIAFFAFPVVPARGSHAWWADRMCMIAAVFALSTLIFMVFDHIRLCDKVATALSGEQETEWPSGLRKQIGKRLGLEVDWLPSILEVRIIQEWTSWVLPMVYYPFTAIAIMLLARFSLFDNWHLSPGLLLTMSIGVMCTIASVVMLQRAARRTQTHSVRRLEEKLERMRHALANARLRAADRASATPGPAADPRQIVLAEKIRRLSGHIRDVRGLADGAFAPILRLAPVRALLLPFGGAGGLAALEYLAVWWQ